MKIIMRTPHLRAQAIRAIQTIPANEIYEVDLKPWKATRSSEQNRRYWSLLTEISEQLVFEGGVHYSPETLHEFFKAKFIGKDVVIIDGDIALVAKTSTTLSTVEFSDYTTQVEAWGSEHGVQFTAWEYPA